MKNKQTRGSRTLMHDLMCGDDLEAVAGALDSGSITERQAKNVARYIARARHIRENPIRTVLIGDENGSFAGEVDPLPDGRWQAKRYGPRYRLDGATPFNTQEEAERFVLADPG